MVAPFTVVVLLEVETAEAPLTEYFPFSPFRNERFFPVNIIVKYVVISAISISTLLFAPNPVLSVAQAQDDKVVAVVNGKNIYESEIEKRLSRYKGMDPSMLQDARDEILNEIMVQLVIAQFIEKEGIQVDDQLVETAINDLRENIKKNPQTAGQSLEDILASFGTSVEQLRSEIRNSVGLRKYFGQKVDDTVLIEYFNANKAAFTGEEVRASHILIDTTELKTKKEYAVAFDKAHKIKGQLDGGADFAEVAKANSHCPSAKNGGDLGYFPRKGVMVEPFAETAFALGVGEISEPIQTQFGFHIIKVTDKKAGKEVAFEDVKEQVKESYIDDQIQDLIKKQLTAANIEINGIN